MAGSWLFFSCFLFFVFFRVFNQYVYGPLGGEKKKKHIKNSFFKMVLGQNNWNLHESSNRTTFNDTLLS